MNTYGATLRTPFAGSKSALVNLDPINHYVSRLNTQPINGVTYTFYQKRASSLKQRVTVTSADVDPSDGKVHVRFVLAPVLDNPGLLAPDGTGPAGGHYAEEQPFFAVELRKITSLTDDTPIDLTGVGAPSSSKGQLFFQFNFSNQPGTVWGSATNTHDNHLYTYSNFQSFDIAPGNAKLQVGDTIEMEVVASGCSKGGHEGHIYVDNFSFHQPASLWVSATGPASVSSANGTTITYTYTYVNNGLSPVSNVTVAPVTPQDSTGANTTFSSLSAPGGACTTPVVGTAGTVSCNFGTLAPGASGSFTVTVTIPNGATGPINNGNYPISGTSVNPLLGPMVQTSLVAPATLSDMSVNATGLPLAATVGTAYAGNYTCTNVGVAAAANATCDAANLPAGVSVTGCTISPASTVWTQPASVPAGQTVTCNVAGTPTTSGMANVIVTTGADNDPNTANNTVTRSVVVAAAPLPPTPVADATSTMAGTAGSFDVSTNDTKPAGSTYSQTGTTCTPAGSMSSAGVASYTAPDTIGATCTVSYQVCNPAPDAANCATSTLTVTATAPPLTPMVDATSTVAGTAGSFDVSTNDTYPAGSTYSQTGTTCTPAGSMSSAGVASYTAPAVAGATCTVTYSVCDPAPNAANCATSTLTVTATAPPLTPDMAISLSGLPGSAQVGVPYSGLFTCANNGTGDATAATTCTVSGLPAGVGVTGCTISPASAAWVAGNAVPAGQTVTCSVSGTPTTAGNATINGSTGATGDSNSGNNTATKSVVVGQSFAPSAANDNATTNYNTAVTVAAFVNDSPGSGSLALSSIDLDPSVAGQQVSRTLAGEGTFTANNNGTVTFTPVSGFQGVVTVPYTIQNSLGQTSNVADITVTVRSAANSVNPIAQNDFGSTLPTTPVTLPVLGNDIAGSGNVIAPTSVVLSGTNPVQGNWLANPDGTVTFTPAPGFVGTATANYTVRDSGGGTSNTATISVAVGGGGAQRQPHRMIVPLLSQSRR